MDEDIFGEQHFTTEEVCPECNKPLDPEEEHDCLGLERSEE